MDGLEETKNILFSCIFSGGVDNSDLLLNLVLALVFFLPQLSDLLFPSPSHTHTHTLHTPCVKMHINTNDGGVSRFGAFLFFFLLSFCHPSDDDLLMYQSQMDDTEIMAALLLATSTKTAKERPRSSSTTATASTSRDGTVSTSLTLYQLFLQV
jgi:hypothetical protein